MNQSEEQKPSRRLYGALAEVARTMEQGYPGLWVGARVKSMGELERMGWVERVRTGEISPLGKRYEVWVLTDAGREALRKYLEG
jgi:DNA-binding PadR family transcriptional regulator